MLASKARTSVPLNQTCMKRLVAAPTYSSMMIASLLMMLKDGYECDDKFDRGNDSIICRCLWLRLWNSL